MNEVKEHLIAARALIDTPEKWAHDNADRKAAGGRCLCAVDACWAVADDYRVVSALCLAVAKGASLHGDLSMVRAARFNDHHDTTHTDILALFDRAIAACDEQVAA